MHFAFLAHEIYSCADGDFRREIDVGNENRRLSKKSRKGSPLGRPLADNLLTMTPMRHFVCSSMSILHAKSVVL